MNDRELLEAAAKAAGIKVLQRGYGYWTIEVHERGMRGWNPLLDDGDALRLAVKLGLYLMSNDQTVFCGGDARHPVEEFNRVEVQACNGDPYAATRRAIVRAAAAMAERKGE